MSTGKYGEAEMFAEMSDIFIHISKTAAKLATAMKNYEKKNGGKSDGKCKCQNSCVPNVQPF